MLPHRGTKTQLHKRLHPQALVYRPTSLELIVPEDFPVCVVSHFLLLLSCQHPAVIVQQKMTQGISVGHGPGYARGKMTHALASSILQQQLMSLPLFYWRLLSPSNKQAMALAVLASEFCWPISYLQGKSTQK